MSIAATQIYRGLYFPDPNFIFTPGTDLSYWSIGSGMAQGYGGNFWPIQPCDLPASSGKALHIATNGMTQTGTTYRLLSDFSAKNAGCGEIVPMAAGTVPVRYFVIARTWASSGTPYSGLGGATGIIDHYLLTYDADRSYIGAVAHTYTITSPQTANGWELHTAYTTMPETTGISYFRHQMKFASGAGQSDRAIQIAWAGVALPINTVSPYADVISSFYDAQALDSALSNCGPIGGGSVLVNPRHYSDGGQPAIAQRIRLTFPRLSTTEKNLVRNIHQFWNMPTPSAQTRSLNTGLSNGGVKQPILIQLRRNEMKLAMYCDVAALEFQQNTARGAIYPETGSTWETTMDLVEWL